MEAEVKTERRFNLPNVVSMKLLLESGVHFGHQTRRWDPRMKPYIFTERNGIHIIDLQQTVARLNEAYAYVRDTVANGGTVLFVGTKKQAQEAVEAEAKRCGMFYVNQRWLGGMLTNFRTIQSRIKRLAELEAQKEAGDFDRLPKKEASRLNDEIIRLNRMLGGIKNMKRLPDMLFIIDPNKERLAIAEARRLDIPIVSLIDTNCNPDEIDYPIPANDDAIRAVKLLSSKIADAALEGATIRQSALEEEAAAAATAAAAEAKIQADMVEAGEMEPEPEPIVPELVAIADAQTDASDQTR